MEKGPKEILELLKHDKIDIGLIALPESLLHQQRCLTFERLLEGKMVVCVNEHSPLRLESAITPAKLAKQTFVLYDDEHIRDFMDQFVASYGEVDILCISNNTQAIYNAVKEGIAVTRLFVQGGRRAYHHAAAGIPDYRAGLLRMGASGGEAYRTGGEAISEQASGRALIFIRDNNCSCITKGSPRFVLRPSCGRPKTAPGIALCARRVNGRGLAVFYCCLSHRISATTGI